MLAMSGTIDDDFLQLVNRLSAPRPVASVFIETGTNLGYTAEAAAKIWPQVFTVELSSECLQQARPRLPANVVCCYGDSADALACLLKVIDKPVVVYLDAHWSGGIAAKGRDEVPLLRELSALRTHKHRDIVICDDYRLIGKSGQCGSPGHEQFPPMEYDWTRVTEELCDGALFGRIEHRSVYKDYLVYVTSG
jgi:hypothetical protein